MVNSMMNDTTSITTAIAVAPAALVMVKRMPTAAGKRAHLPAQLHSIQLRHHNITQNQVWPDLKGEINPNLSI